MAKVRAMGVAPPPGVTRPAPPASPVRAYIPAEPSHVQPQSALLKVGLAAAAAISLGALFALTRTGPDKPTPVTTAIAVSTPPVVEVPAALDDGAAKLSRDDIAFLNELSSRLQSNRGTLATPAELQRVQRLADEHTDVAALKDLLMELYLRSADQDLRAGSYAAVEVALGRMKLLNDKHPNIYAFEAQARARQDDWAGALVAAQRYDEVQGPLTVASSINLAVAFERTGRRADALAVLDRPVFASCRGTVSGVEAGACRAADEMRQVLGAPATTTSTTTTVNTTALAASATAPAPSSEERTRAALEVDASKQRIESDRFDIRFDGENQTGVARDVRFVLDRAYTRLADIYYERPRRKIPVVLHSSQDYFSKTGAPWWSGGVYSTHNGSIQIPIRGLPQTLPREMEDVLVHELSHAFVDEMSGGRASRVLQEGLAQYVSGKRIENEMTLGELKGLATSGRQSVMSFYMLSLVICQHMVDSRGQGKVNDLLKAMKETGSEDGGYRKVFGQAGSVIEKEILETFWRRYS